MSALQQYIEQLKQEQKTTKVMAAGTVGYTDTRGNNKDYTSMIAKSIKIAWKQHPIWRHEERASLQRTSRGRWNIIRRSRDR